MFFQQKYNQFFIAKEATAKETEAKRITEEQAAKAAEAKHIAKVQAAKGTEDKRIAPKSPRSSYSQ